MSEEQFEENKNLIIYVDVHDRETLNERCNSYWKQIVNQLYDFDQPNTENSCISMITKV